MTTSLNEQFATTKILNGLGDVEKWASMLTPAKYAALLERVDLEFVETNPDFFQPTDEVELELFTKNVETLIVKVFEINTENYYRRYQSEIDTDVNLDGLVPNFEETFQYKDAPALRVKRSFKLPQIRDHGVYIVDFIAGGKSSRALIRKGRLQAFGQPTGAGQLFSIVDEAGRVVMDASIWMSGRRYQPDENGKILVPFSTQSGKVNLIITNEKFSCLQRVTHAAERYHFSAGIMLDRESLTRSNEAKILLRPSLRISGGSPVPVSMLEDTKLVVTSTNLDGIASTKTFEDLELSEGNETVCKFVVPPRLRKLDVHFTAEIENISTGKKSQACKARVVKHQPD